MSKKRENESSSDHKKVQRLVDMFIFQSQVSVVFAMLMMLAFLVDQVQQLACRLFQAVWAKLGSKRSLWEQMRALFFGYRFDSMEDIFKALLYGFKRERLVILED